MGFQLKYHGVDSGIAWIPIDRAEEAVEEFARRLDIDLAMSSFWLTSDYVFFRACELQEMGSTGDEAATQALAEALARFPLIALLPDKAAQLMCDLFAAARPSSSAESGGA